MRKHHKKWNVVQSGHCTVVLLHLAASYRQAASRYRDTYLGHRITSVDGLEDLLDSPLARTLKVHCNMFR